MGLRRRHVRNRKCIKIDLCWIWHRESWKCRIQSFTQATLESDSLCFLFVTMVSSYLWWVSQLFESTVSVSVEMSLYKESLEVRETYTTETYNIYIYIYKKTDKYVTKIRFYLLMWIIRSWHTNNGTKTKSRSKIYFNLTFIVATKKKTLSWCYHV